MKTRVTYHCVLCWEKFGQVWHDPPCKDYTDKQEAISDAELIALKIKPRQWIAVFEVEEKWNGEREEWEVKDPEDWMVVYETE